MTPFDAICHAFSVMSLGGFSTHDASVGYFDSPAIELVLIVLHGGRGDELLDALRGASGAAIRRPTAAIRRRAGS